MIVWLNGAFGAGKTTTSRSLVAHSGLLRQFDPAWVGFMLANNLADHPVTDFQQYPSRRHLVPVVADTLHARIDADQEEPERIRPWRHRHVDVYQDALTWLSPAADLVVDTVALDAPAAARQIHAATAVHL